MSLATKTRFDLAIGSYQLVMTRMEHKIIFFFEDIEVDILCYQSRCPEHIGERGSHCINQGSPINVSENENL